MLVVFDLDDTLIDTSCCITPKKLKMALLAMQQEGCVLEDFQKSYSKLLKINQTTTSSLEALKIFLTPFSDKEKFYLIGKKQLSEPLVDDFIVFPTQSAKETLQKLKKSHILAIVTVGDEQLQRQKLRKAGIDCALFSIIKVLPHNDKKISYEEIIRKFPYKDVIVCGDKVEIDLQPAKQLQLTTVHICLGRGKKSAIHSPYVDYEIKVLKEIIPIIMNNPR